MNEMIQTTPLLKVRSLTKRYGTRVAVNNVSFDLHAGEVLAIVGESGSGKTSLLQACSGRTSQVEGSVEYVDRFGYCHEITTADAPDLTRMWRDEWGFVTQNPRDGLRLNVSAGANVAERLMQKGGRHYGDLRATALRWLAEVEIAEDRVDDLPRQFSGGMQQRVQLARTLATQPRLVFLDEPTGGLDVSVQARLLDLLRRLVRELHLAAIVVTHDLAVARLLAHRLLVLHNGELVETGVTDRVLDDPQHAYTQLLVSSVLTV